MKKFLLRLVASPIANGIAAGGGAAEMTVQSWIHSHSALIVFDTAFTAVLWMIGCYFAMRWAKQKLAVGDPAEDVSAS